MRRTVGIPHGAGEPIEAIVRTVFAQPDQGTMVLLFAAEVPVMSNVTVWGDDTHRQVSDNPPTEQFKVMASGGGSQLLGVTNNGIPRLWGGGAMNPIPALVLEAGETYDDVALGPSFAAAIRLKGTGIQTFGHFADPAKSPADLPPAYQTIRFKAVTAGGGHGVAIAANGTLVQWGTGEGKQPTPPGIKFYRVRGRHDYSLALDTDGRLYGWGGDNLFAPPEAWAAQRFGASGHPLSNDVDWKFVRATAGPAFEPSETWGYWVHPGPFGDIAAGSKSTAAGSTAADALPHVLAVKAGQVVGWGDDSQLQISGAPPNVKFILVAGGRGFSIGLDENHMVHQWGDTARLGTKPTGPFGWVGAGTNHASALRPYEG